MMKKIITILLLFAGYFAGAQDTIKYTPMTAAGYQFKYGKFDSLIHVPYQDTALKRGATRPGAIVCNPADTLLYWWTGLRWSKFGSTVNGGGVVLAPGIDSITFTITGWCWWSEGFPRCTNNTPDTVITKYPLNTILREVSGALFDTLRIKGSNIPGQVLTVGIDSDYVAWETPSIAGDISFRWSILDSLNTPPGSPATGDIYEVGTVPTGAWVGHAKEIATWDGAAWTFEVPDQGDLLFRVSNDIVSKYTSVWVRVGRAPILQGGQAFAANMNIGPTDNFALLLRTQSNTRMTIAGTGAITFNGLTGSGNALMVLSSAGTISRGAAPLSLTTTGTSGAASYSSVTGVLNVPQYSGGGSGDTALADLSDVTITSPLTNHILVYNEGTGKWENLMPALYDFAGLQDNDYMQYNLSLGKWQNRRTTYAATSAVLKMMVVDTTTGLFYRTEVPTLANDSWALAGNAATSANFLGTTNNTSINFRQNNVRYHQMDSLGGFNSFPPAGNTNVYTAYRNASTTNYAYRLSVESSEAIIRTINSALIFKTNYNSGAGQLENFRLTESVTGATRASLPQAILTGKLQAKIALPSGTEISNAIDIANTTPVIRYSLGLDVNNDAVFSLNNVGWRLYQSNDAASGYAFGAGDYMRVFNETGNLMIKNKGTYTQDTSSRFSVISDRQGTIPAPVMTTTNKLGITTGMVGGQITAGGSGYVNATYSQVPFIDGTGTGARAFTVTVAGGVVTAVNMSSNSGRGANYAIGDVLSISNANLGGSGSGFQYTVTLLTDSSTAKGLQVYDSTVRQRSQYNGINWDGGVIVSSAGTLTLAHGNDYIFTGTTATYTLPAISTTIIGRQNGIKIKNRGSGTITLNSNAGSTIYSSSAVGTINVVSGAAAELLPDGTYFNVMFNN